MLQLLKETVSSRHAERLETIVIWLIVVEIGTLPIYRQSLSIFTLHDRSRDYNNPGGSVLMNCTTNLTVFGSSRDSTSRSTSGVHTVCVYICIIIHGLSSSSYTLVC